MKKSLLHAVLLSLALASTPSLARTTFSNMFVFGDSLSDIGNLAALDDFSFLNQPPYDHGFSNGPRAVELLAKRLRLKLRPSLHLSAPPSGKPRPAGTNFAVAGANARNTSALDLPTQLAAFAKAQQSGVPDDALYVVFIGGNDVRDARDAADDAAANQIIDDAAKSVDSAVQSLIHAGARHIMVIGAPNIGAIPETKLRASFLPPDQRPAFIQSASLKSRQFNKSLFTLLKTTESNSGVDIVTFDLFEFFDNVRRDNNALGFFNDTDNCYISFPPVNQPQGFQAPCTTEKFDQFVFFDEIHPTARVQGRAARALYAVVPEPPRMSDD
jgi:phospholipase/lecithinase/hemolysin